MFTPGSCACSTTQSMPAMIWETSTAPVRLPTLALTIRAFGATADCDGEVRRGVPQQDPAPKGCASPCDPASCCGGLAHSALPTRDTGSFSSYWLYRITHAEQPNP